VLADHDWTPELTAERLVEAFRLLPGRGIYSPVVGSLLSLTGHRLEGLGIVACAQNCLGHRSLECQQLLAWARVKATAGDEWDASISRICREFSGVPADQVSAIMREGTGDAFIRVPGSLASH
jgi:hypothetical protein